jgi:hypothetical protein
MNYLKSKQRLLILVAIIACCSFLFGCATGTVMKWTGPTEFVGRGGAVQTKDGIDFYMSGEPAGKFKVLSIIQGSYYRGGNLLMSALSEKAAMDGAIKEAKAEGADAIIVLSSSYEVLGTSTTGNGYGTVNGTMNSNGSTTTINATENVNYWSSTSVQGAQNGSVALVKYIDVKR